MKNQITESNWREELYELASNDLTVGVCEDFIQSLITSIKQEEREKFRLELNSIKRQVDAYHSRGRIDKDTYNLLKVIIGNSKTKLNEDIQSLTEEDITNSK